MRNLLILAAILLSACALSQYNPSACDRDPENCKLCPPGQRWVPGGGGACVPRETPCRTRGQVRGADGVCRCPACPPGSEVAVDWIRSDSWCYCRPIETPTPAPSATPTAAPPMATPTPTVQPTPTPAVVTPTPRPSPTATPAPPVDGTCMLASSPWTRPAPPSVPVPVRGTFGVACPKGFRRVGPDRSSQLGCVAGWKCAAGTNGRSPAEGAQIGLAGNHVVIDIDGMVRDVDNGRPCGMDAWGRKVCDGRIEVPTWEGREEKWWAQHAACDPVPCAAEIPPPALPTPPPAAPPVQGCRAVEQLQHFMAPGDRCHQVEKDSSGQTLCLVDSTIRPICDKDHMDDWCPTCGCRSHDPDYENPANAFDWTVVGASDLGGNRKNYAQRWITGSAGSIVTVRVCIPANATTPDGCRITPRGQAGCGERTFTLP